MQPHDWALFAIGTAGLVWVSRHALRHPHTHGFYRFFAWVCMLALLLLNYPMWHHDMFSLRQVVSWALLGLSAVLAVRAVYVLRRLGAATPARDEAGLLPFEKTTQLVTQGVYHYIRHPMYAALLYLAWGIYLKQPTLVTTVLVLIASVALLLTALRDEAECRAYFGEAYTAYMQCSKRFIPLVF